MFRKSKTIKQLSLQSSVSQHLSGSTYKQYSDTSAWQNIFFNQITSRIDEDLFSCLFTEDTGAPNSPVRVLISMMVLKEGFGWSDQELFENCKFNLLVRKALGIINLDEPVPAESTYYLLRKRICEHQKQTDQNLFEQTFKSITKSQIAEFEVSGKRIRMDSKLIGSNIAFYSRYEIIHRSLCLYIKNAGQNLFFHLPFQDQEKLKEFTEEQSGQTVYRCTKEQIKERLNVIGIMIYKILILPLGNKGKDYQTLKRIFEEQFKTLQDNQIELRPKEEIKADSIQSPYDTECGFRTKNEKSVKGYNHNVTETCDDNSLNLIVDLQIEPATSPDNGFVIPATENSQSILIEKVRGLHTDGAYNSDQNKDYMANNGINFYLTGVQGAAGRFDLTPTTEGLQVIDKHTGEIIIARQIKEKKYRIKTEKGYRYFNEKEIDNCQLRKQIEQMPDEIKNKRNNVEATIYQLAYNLRKDKTKYRGLLKNKIWATLRCLWINFIRISKNVIKICQRTIVNVNYTLQLSNIVKYFNYYFSFNPFRIK